ncbi:MAG: hypothetical protein M3325_06910, partial [Actinomycetota bacterium]|nr:hypothetical protein [Actinomycetota bacterium]
AGGATNSLSREHYTQAPGERAFMICEPHTGDDRDARPVGSSPLHHRGGGFATDAASPVGRVQAAEQLEHTRD